MARVLYIDDCHRDRTLASIALRGCGHEFECTADGDDALDLANSYAPDCIVVNPNVAVVGGDSLIKHITSIAPDAKVIVTGCGLRSQTVEAVIKGGAYACLSRPFQIDQLVDAINGALSNEKLGAA